MNPNMPATGIGAADPLLPEAAAWAERMRAQGENIVRHPVSSLQRHFGLGYARACALAEALALDQYWRIGVDDDGQRYARLRLRPQPDVG